jgi:hypothetical protein
MSLCDKIDVMGSNEEGNYSAADFSKVILRLVLHSNQRCNICDCCNPGLHVTFISCLGKWLRENVSDIEYD